MHIRHATLKDLDTLTKIEALCFPALEAASKKAFQERLSAFPNCFYLLVDENDQILSFVNGMRINEKTIPDAVYSNVELHQEDGYYFAIMGLNTDPDYQGQGYASKVILHLIEDTASLGLNGIILTCKDHMLPFYEKLGFENKGLSASTHGNATWYDMMYQHKN